MLLRFGTEMLQRPKGQISHYLTFCKNWGRGWQNVWVKTKFNHIGAQRGSLSFPISCSVSKPQCVKGDWCRGKISHFLTTVKFRGGAGEISEWILRPNRLYTFDGAFLGYLEDYSVGVKEKKKDAQNIKACQHTLGGTRYPVVPAVALYCSNRWSYGYRTFP